MSRAPFTRSPEQGRAADPSGHVWVGASAGSGKTLVLVDRILRLLLTGAPPERLLCITFTKAAAAEMANRLHSELEAWVTAPDPLLAAYLTALGVAPAPDIDRRARQLFARVLDTPGGLRIQTIHAFCESVLGRFPIEAEIPPQFSILDERDATELLRRARDFVLDAARRTPGSVLERAVTTVSGRVGEERFEDVLKAMVRDRARFLTVIGGSEPADSLVRAALGVAANETPETTLAAACIDQVFDGPSLRRIGAAMASGTKTDKERAQAMLDWLAAMPERRIDLFQAYCKAFLTQQGAVLARLVTKGVLAQHPDAEDLLGQEAARLLEVLQRQRRADVARASAALVTVAQHLFEAYEKEKARLNRLDYDDLILRTRALLLKEDMAPWVLFKLDGGIDHVLVDEAQDTSREQWDIVAALTGEFFAGAGARDPRRTLFVVGDEKQSIYSFQGADPAAFDDMQQRFKKSAQRVGEALVEVPLLTSYRSVPAVLEFIDRSFAAPDAQAGVVRHSWEGHKTSRHDQPGLIELWDTFKKPKREDTEDDWALPDRMEVNDRPEAKLALRIATLIARWVTPGPQRDILAATGRPVQESDILILVQTRKPFFGEMVQALKRAGVAVAGADRIKLLEELAVMDLMALGRVMLLPEDDLSLAEVLKSPLIGFDDDDLFAIAWNRGDRSLWSALRERSGRDPRFAAARDFLQAQMARADLIAPFDFYAQMLGSGGRQKLLARLGSEASDPIDEFLNLALTHQRDHPASLQGFLHWLSSGRADIKRDLDQGRPEVRVMTVHGAKGLEAPIVFLPDTTALPNTQQDSLYWSAQDAVPVPFWLQRKEDAVGVAAVARSAADQRRLEEYRRLFYVAATRARDRLYVGGWGDPKPGSWYALAQRGLENLGDTVVVDFPHEPSVAVRRHDTRGTAGPTPQETARPAPVWAMPGWLQHPPPPEPVPPRPLVPSQPSEAEPAVRSPFATDDTSRFRRGTAIHRLLQVLPGLPPSQQDATARAYLARASLGFSADAQSDILRAVQSVLRDDRFAAVFAAGSVAEAPIAGRLGTSVISGQIDRLAITASDVLIVDYKTNRLAPATMADVPLLYRRQMAAYWAALRRIYPNHRVRAALLWTEGPTLMELPDDMLEAHAP